MEDPQVEALGLSEQVAAGPGLDLACSAQIYVYPPGEQVLRIPGGLPVA
jgi:hypothetical protein